METYKNVKDSLTEQCHFIMPKDINGSGRLYGGTLMSWIDETAGITARRHCGHAVTTAEVDNLQFRDASFLNELIVLIGKVTFVGSTSMDIQVDTYREVLNGTRTLVNRAFLVVVAIDENGRPIPVPRLRLRSVSEKAAWEAGSKRYALRKQRKEEGF